MNNNGWISVKEKLPEGKQDVLVYWYEKPFDIHQVELLTYFKKDDPMDWETCTEYDTLEKNLLETIASSRRIIRAPEDGFYIYEAEGEADGYRRHADIITHWQPLPEPPGRAGK